MRVHLSVVSLTALLTALVPAQTESIPNPHFTAPEGEPLTGWRICVDAGHGGQIWGKTRGYTGGTRSAVSDLTESDVNLRVALFLWDLLTQAGAEVVMTRTYETRMTEDVVTEEGTDLWGESKRAELAIRHQVAEVNDCDFLVSVHHNAAGNPSVNFSTTFHFDPRIYHQDAKAPPTVEHSPDTVAASKALSQAILARLDERLQIDTRPARHGDYHVLRETPLTAVLVECSFMTSPDQARRLEDLATARLEAIAIFEGILDYCTATSGEPLSAQPAPEVTD
jgi:N-acetylmuramoyl-L-alanine amidase